MCKVIPARINQIRGRNRRAIQESVGGLALSRIDDDGTWLCLGTAHLGIEGAAVLAWDRHADTPQHKGEGRTLIHGTFGPDAAPVPLHDALRQPDPSAWKLLGMVQPLEYAEELVCVLHVRVHAIVPDIMDMRAVDVPAAHLNVRDLPPACELQRVVQQVHEHLLEQLRGRLTMGQVPGRQLHPPVVALLVHRCQCLLHQIR